MFSVKAIPLRTLSGVLSVFLMLWVGTSFAQPNPSLEVEHWRSIKNTNDPVLYQDHLEKFPNGTFSEIAKQRLLSIQKGIPLGNDDSVAQWNGAYWIYTSFDHGGARCGLDGRGEVKLENGRASGYWTNGKAGGGLEGTVSEKGEIDVTVKTGVVFVYIKGSAANGIFEGDWETRGEVICGGRWTMTPL
jgi:hypothetical protein